MTIPVALCSNMLVQLDQKWETLRMNKAFLTTAVLLLSSLPAFSQDTRGGDERRPSPTPERIVIWTISSAGSATTVAKGVAAEHPSFCGTVTWSWLSAVTHRTP